MTDHTASTQGELNQIVVSDVSPDLAAEIVGSVEGWTAWVAPYLAATVANQRYEIVHNARFRRGGIVFVGSGSSGAPTWTDATTPEEVLARFLSGEIIA